LTLTHQQLVEDFAGEEHRPTSALGVGLKERHRSQPGRGARRRCREHAEGKGAHRVAYRTPLVDRGENRQREGAEGLQRVVSLPGSALIAPIVALNTHCGRYCASAS